MFAAKFMSSPATTVPCEVANRCFRLLVRGLLNKKRAYHSVTVTWTNFFASTAGGMNKQDMWLVVQGIHFSCKFDFFSEWVSNLHCAKLHDVYFFLQGHVHHQCWNFVQIDVWRRNNNVTVRRQTDGRTDRHWTTEKTALIIASRGKNEGCRAGCGFTYQQFLSKY